MSKISTTPNERAVSCCAARTISAAQLSAVCRCSCNVQPSPGLYTAQTHCASPHSDRRRQRSTRNEARPTRRAHNNYTADTLTVRLDLDKNKILYICGTVTFTATIPQYPLPQISHDLSQDSTENPWREDSIHLLQHGPRTTVSKVTKQILFSLSLITFKTEITKVRIKAVREELTHITTVTLIKY